MTVLRDNLEHIRGTRERKTGRPRNRWRWDLEDDVKEAGYNLRYWLKTGVTGESRWRSMPQGEGDEGFNWLIDWKEGYHQPSGH